MSSSILAPVPDNAVAAGTSDSEQPQVVDLRLMPQVLVAKVAKYVAHPEYMIFQGQLGTPKVPLGPPNAPGRNGMRQQFNVWDLINDAIDGTGGFVDGSYLVPHELETAGQVSGFALKFFERMQLARYDNFAKIICDGPWNSITSMKDIIVRDAGGHQRLEEFWDSVDGAGTDIFDFVEYPVSQARRFGTGWVFMDRRADIATLKEDLEAQPWAYCVPTRNVVWWEFDQAGALAAVVYRDPADDGEYAVQDDPAKSPLMVWTQRGWSRWLPTGNTDSPYRVERSGPNELGEVPAVLIHDEYPGRGRAFGKSNMLAIARMAMDVYNRDSEIREIERKCAFPLLSVSINDILQAASISIGTNAVLATDGKFPPHWLEPILSSIDKLASERTAAKEAAFIMSEMAGLIGHATTIQTSSGFHAEVELTKTGRKVGRVASSTEAAENKMARLFLALIGEPDVNYSISYPRTFGMVDVDTMIERTRKQLELGLGEADTVATLTDYYAARYPRKTAVEIDEMAQAGAAAKAAAREAIVPVPEQNGAVQTARQRLGLQLRAKAGTTTQ